MSANGQDRSAAKKEVNGLVRQMQDAMGRGHNALCKLRAIDVVLDDLEERATALKCSLLSSDPCQ
jgi:hypothetical protein